ncbi:MAG: ABC transporter substrate-binding protein [Beijerinckiaceae bacterium]
MRQITQSDRMTRRSTLKLALAAGASGLAIPAIGQSQTTLEFPTYQIDESFGDWWKAVIAEFEKLNPRVKIALTNGNSNDHHRMLATRFAAGNPPDIVHMTARFVWGYGDEGVIEPLDRWMDKTDIKQSWVPAQKSLTVDGKTWGLLLLTYGFALFYNEKMFAEAGVKVPVNEAEFLAAAKALTRDRDGDGRIDQFGVALNTSNSSWGYVQFMHIHCGRNREIVSNGKLDDVAEIAKSLKIMDDLVKGGMSPRGLDSTPQRQAFWQGNAAMYMDGSWAPGYASTAAASVKNTWKVAKIPYPNMAGGPSNCLAIAKDTPAEKKELVWKFMELVSSVEWQRKYAELSGNPPGRRGMISDAARAQWPWLPLFDELTSMDSRSHLPIGYEKDFNKFSDLFTEQMTAMVAGQISADEAARRFADRFNRELARPRG